MTTSQVRLERRAGQRFPYLLPISFSDSASSIEGHGFTQDLSSRGVFFITDAALTAGAAIELRRSDALRDYFRGEHARAMPGSNPPCCETGSIPAGFFRNGSGRNQDRRCGTPRRLRIFARVGRGLVDLSPSFVPSSPAPGREPSGSIARPPRSRLMPRQFP